MSVKVITQVWDADLSRPQLLVMLALADWSDDEGGGVYPSINRLAYKTGYSPRNIRRLMAQLRKSGVLVRVRPPEHGRGVEYQIATYNLPKRTESFPDWLARHRAAGEDVSENDEETEGEAKMAPLPPTASGGGHARPPGEAVGDSHIRKGPVKNTSGGNGPKTRSAEEAELWARRIAENLNMTDEEKARVFGE